MDSRHARTGGAGAQDFSHQSPGQASWPGPLLRGGAPPRPGQLPAPAEPGDPPGQGPRGPHQPALPEVLRAPGLGRAAAPRDLGLVLLLRRLRRDRGALAAGRRTGSACGATSSTTSFRCSATTGSTSRCSSMDLAGQVVASTREEHLEDWGQAMLNAHDLEKGRLTTLRRSDYLERATELVLQPIQRSNRTIGYFIGRLDLRELESLLNTPVDAETALSLPRLDAKEIESHLVASADLMPSFWLHRRGRARPRRSGEAPGPAGDSSVSGHDPRRRPGRDPGAGGHAPGPGPDGLRRAAPRLAAPGIPRGHPHLRCGVPLSQGVGEPPAPLRWVRPPRHLRPHVPGSAARSCGRSCSSRTGPRR